MKNKVLLTRFSSIGDIIITTPVIRALATQRDDLEIHFATKTAYQSLLEHNPYVDQLHVLGSDFSELVQKLREHKFTYFVDLHKNIRTQTLRQKLRFDQYHTYKKNNLEKSLLVNLGINRLNGIHNVDRYFKALAKLGIEDDGQGYDFFFPENFSFKIPDSLNSNYLVFAIGGKQVTKRLPKDMMLSLCKCIDFPIALVGGKDEETDGEWLQSQTENCVNLCGKLSLLESAHIIKRSKRVISHDTGMMHVACALEKDLLSIWGNTTTDFGFAPRYSANSKANSLISETQGLKCRPCSRLGKDKCPKGHFDCMRKINLEEISQWANQQ